MYAKRRIDLFGVIDLVALRADIQGVLGIQTTTQSNLWARRKKCSESADLKLWLQCGNRFDLHGWAKHGPRGERKVWTLKLEPVTLSSLSELPERDAAVGGGPPGLPRL